MYSFEQHLNCYLILLSVFRLIYIFVLRQNIILGPYTPNILQNGLGPVLQIFLYLGQDHLPRSRSNIKVTIDLFDIFSSQFERDQDHARLQGRGLDWFSGSGVKLCTHREPAGNFTTCTISRISTNFVVNTCQHTYRIKVNLHPSRF